EQFLTGPLALAGVFGVGEGHLFHHRKARRLVSGDFAKLGSLFQSFPKLFAFLETTASSALFSPITCIPRAML
ncbi:hypothetical protein, partial [Pseudomonas syringae]|uniref:hypothetical protein n=1 Tax=Pseudomonas syringae TaxID=317 RepID=UPI001C5586E9